jgi:hypothetical protein
MTSAHPVEPAEQKLLNRASGASTANHFFDASAPSTGSTGSKRQQTATHSQNPRSQQHPKRWLHTGSTPSRPRKWAPTDHRQQTEPIEAKSSRGDPYGRLRPARFLSAGGSCAREPGGRP